MTTISSEEAGSFLFLVRMAVVNACWGLRPLVLLKFRARFVAEKTAEHTLLAGCSGRYDRTIILWRRYRRWRHRMPLKLAVVLTWLLLLLWLGLRLKLRPSLRLRLRLRFRLHIIQMLCSRGRSVSRLLLILFKWQRVTFYPAAVPVDRDTGPVPGKEISWHSAIAGHSLRLGLDSCRS